mmetsp:Transcript_37490/g.57433  ORF Transcript_37490/g.57433 Transcript_37490/m.57433 type:complete len:140 (+) Transcript_37490:52-471(+)
MAQSKFTISSLNEMVNSLAHKSKSEAETGPKTERQSNADTKTVKPTHSIPTVSSVKQIATQTLTLRSEKSPVILDVHKRGIFEHSTNETADGMRLPTVNINSKVQTLESRPPLFDDKLVRLAHKISISKKPIKTTRLLN